MYDLFMINSGRLELVMREITSFKKSEDVFYIKNKHGQERAIKGTLKKISGSKITIEGHVNRSIVTALAPLNF